MKEQLQKDFDNTIKNLSLSQKDIEIKKFSLDNFINKGFPNRREEDWKFFTMIIRLPTKLTLLYSWMD